MIDLRNWQIDSALIDVIAAGGWLMVAILACSIVATGIVIERFFALRRRRVAWRGLVDRVIDWERKGELDQDRIDYLARCCPLGRVLSAGLVNRHHSRDVIKESVEDTGRHVVHQLERYLNSLGTIAAITPLLGLLGTVLGMIKVFNAITTQGVGDPKILAAGISEALVTTAAGLAVAIPAVMFHRYFRGRVDALVIYMEEQALKLVQAFPGGEPAAVIPLETADSHSSGTGVE
jgi:biopolymer transport protein ExbB